MMGTTLSESMISHFYLPFSRNGLILNLVHMSNPVKPELVATTESLSGCPHCYLYIDHSATYPNP